MHDPNLEGETNTDAGQPDPTLIDDPILRVHRTQLLLLVGQINLLRRNLAKATNEQAEEPLNLGDIVAPNLIKPAWYKTSGRLNCTVHFEEFEPGAKISIRDGQYKRVDAAMRRFEKDDPDASALLAMAYVTPDQQTFFGPTPKVDDEKVWKAWFGSLPYSIANRLLAAIHLFRREIMNEGNG